jgi:hypothetical protein
VDFKFGESDAAKNASQGSTVYFWSIEGKAGAVAERRQRLGRPAPSNRVVQAGEGFFLKEATVTTITTKSPTRGPKQQI